MDGYVVTYIVMCILTTLIVLFLTIQEMTDCGRKNVKIAFDDYVIFGTMSLTCGLFWPITDLLGILGLIGMAFGKIISRNKKEIIKEK